MTPLDLIIDTETTGLRRAGLPLNDPSQPHILELAIKLVDDEGKPTGNFFQCIIRPEGWAIEPEAQRVHGITEAHAYQVGIPRQAALIVLQAFTEKARRIVGHNIEFERALIARELADIGANGRWWHQRSQNLHCTMELSTPILKIPGQYGDWRWPSLEEAHNFFDPGWGGNGRDQGGWHSNHRAEGDLEACLRVWRAIQERAHAH